MDTIVDTGNELGRMLEERARRFGKHPFYNDYYLEELETLLSHYLAMSIAFPYVQAGAIAILMIFEVIAIGVVGVLDEFA